MAFQDPALRTKVGTEDPITAVDAAFIKDNSINVGFTRAFTDAQRQLFDSGTNILSQYTNFTSMRKTEYNQWVAQYGAAQINAYLALDSGGQPYEQVNGGSELLCDFSNTNWLDFRLATIPDWEAVGKLGSTNLDFISMDLCPLYPTKFLVGTQGNPFADVPAWKTNMLAAVAYVRARIDSGIKLICNGLREFVFDDPAFLDNPAAFEPYDGSDLIDPGTYADAAAIEAGITYTPSNVNEWLFSLRAVYRASNANKLAVISFKTDTSAEPQSNTEVQRRVNNFVSYALVHKPNYSYYNLGSENEYSPYPIALYPENLIALGTPVEAVDSRFTSYDSPALGLITRTFSSGYVALFNFDATATAVPVAYQSGYQQVLPNAYFSAPNGSTQAALITRPVPTTIDPGQGMLLQVQSNVLTVTTNSLVQLSGNCTLYFGVGETGMLLDTGTFTAGDNRAEATPTMDMTDGADWEFGNYASDAPGDRSTRDGVDYTALDIGHQVPGTVGTGRWLRAVVRARTPRKHKMTAAELDISLDDGTE